jgi:hypothetical protein
MKALKVVLLSLGLIFLSSTYALAGSCDGKAAKACAKMKSCKWDKKAKACHGKTAAKKAAPAAKKAPPAEPKEEAPAEEDMGDEGEAGEQEDSTEY